MKDKETLTLYLLLVALAITVMVGVGWALGTLWGPRLIEAIYKGESWHLLNGVITGQADHPLAEYLGHLDVLVKRFILVGGLVALAPLLVAAEIRYSIAKKHEMFFYISIFLVLAAVIVFRAPQLFTTPRFWAEEGTVYFLSGYHNSWLEALFQVHQGYYSLVPTLVGILATLPPPEYAPLLTTSVSLLVQLGILGALFANRSDYLNTPGTKLLAALAIVFVGAWGEIWLNTINAQFHLPIFVFLVLIDNKVAIGKLKRGIYYLGALIAGLTGVQSCMLTPLFLYRYYSLRQRADRTLFLILAAASVAQLTAIVYAHLLAENTYFSPSMYRFAGGSLVTIVKLLIHYNLQYPILGSAFKGTAISITVALGVTGVMIYALYNRKYMFHLSAVWLLSTLSLFGSLQMAGGMRYFYASSVIAVLFLINVAADCYASSQLKGLAGVLVLGALITGISTFKDNMRHFAVASWPVWSEEVRLWRQDPARELLVHPQGPGTPFRWKLRLVPRSAEGSPLRTIDRASDRAK